MADAWVLTHSSIPACNLPAEPLFFRKYLLSLSHLQEAVNMPSTSVYPEWP